ncbi:hypothetical protein [Sorangium sp. So ce388]|uniref:hypothetical protein n=1 Tax=Sorangium sp. So ce388 TaxID=3133309 RepID=UPI003F5CBAB5
MKRVGDVLPWSSGAGALQQSRRGRIIAIAEPGERLSEAVEKTGRRATRLMAGEKAKSARYVVEVQTVNGPAYYAPLVKTIDRQLREQAEVRATLARVGAL